MSRPAECPDITCGNFSFCGACLKMGMNMSIETGFSVNPFEKWANTTNLVGWRPLDRYDQEPIDEAFLNTDARNFERQNKKMITNPPLPKLSPEAKPAQVLKDYQFMNNSHLRCVGTLESLSMYTYMPGRTEIIIGKNKYLSSDIHILGDNNLLPENIKKGVTIFGVTGTYEG